LRKKQDWPSRLAEAIEAGRHKRFQYGAHDCALFCAACILAVTDFDPAADFRGRYSTALGAKRKLTQAGFSGLEDLAEKTCGPALENIFKGQRGDVALVDTPEGPALGIIDLTGRKIVLAGPEGLSFLKLDRALKVWRV
jgi:hypothetical protein